MYWLGRSMQMGGLLAVGAVLILNLSPQGITMGTMLLLVAFGVLLFMAGTTLLSKQ